MLCLLFGDIAGIIRKEVKITFWSVNLAGLIFRSHVFFAEPLNYQHSANSRDIKDISANSQISMDVIRSSGLVCGFTGI